jgi:hypothetical protein
VNAIGILLTGQLLLQATAPAPQAAGAATPRLLTSDEVIARILKAAEQPADATVEQTAGVAKPSDQPTAKQISAPAASGAGPSNVDRASFPELFALAADSGLVSFNGGAATLSVNPFGLVSAVRPSVLDLQSEYEKYEILRRLGGSLTLGGKGEKFDRDGDGKEDDPLTAQSLGDIVTYELKVRLWGSRDRRDPQNWKRYFKKTDGSLKAVETAIRSLVALADKDLVRDADNLPIGVSAAGFEARLATTEAQTQITALRNAYAALKADIKAANAETDKRLLVTVVGGGTQQKAQFGRNHWKLGLRGEGASGRLDHTLNVDWSTVDAVTGDDPTVFKSGYKLSTKVLKGTALTKDGATLSFDAAFERYDHVPDAKYRTVAKAGVKLELPISGSATLPLSATYANHRDLLTGQKGWIGHVGVAWDLSALKSLTAKKE